jgi:cytochrome oxidase Cu insertion factor (SCO1/SenC/PrrC family)
MRRGPAAVLVGAAVVTLLGSACSSGTTSRGDTGRSSAARVSAPAPNFSLRSAQGETVSLAGFRSRKPVLLYFSMGPG